MKVEINRPLALIIISAIPENTYALCSVWLYTWSHLSLQLDDFQPGTGAPCARSPSHPCSYRYHEFAAAVGAGPCDRQWQDHLGRQRSGCGQVISIGQTHY